VVADLVQFLISEHQRIYGVYSRDEQTLFKFWKEKVSKVYKIKALKKAHATG
jgi:hypothetical protein